MAKKQRSTSRNARHASQLALAESVHVPTQADVCVVGGGAAGLVASIVAAEHGAQVVVLEKDLECGRRILATGNGRCNFANRLLNPNLYNDPAFVERVCGSHWLDDILDFFHDCGLAWAEEAEGRLYPLSRQAASVRNVLLCRANAAHVTLAPARTVTEIRQNKDLFEVAWHNGFGFQQIQYMRAQALIVATGGLSDLSLAHLDLCVVSPSPILCPLACQGPLLARLDGRRVRASASLWRNHELVCKESGEVLFRPYGLSGIVVFNMSRMARSADKIVLDLLPTLSHKDALALADQTLDGILDPVVAQALLSVTRDTQTAIRLAKSLEFSVVGPADTEHAQVYRGGLSTSGFDPTTLEAKHVTKLHACGEALNVDGPCGGYNLAWAWKSGLVAGLSAAKGL